MNNTAVQTDAVVSAGAISTPPLRTTTPISRDRTFRQHLRLRTVLIVTAAAVVLLHQAYVLFAKPVEASHAWGGVALLLSAVVLVLGIYLIWTDYQQLRNYQRASNQSHGGLEQAMDVQTQALTETRSLWESLSNAFPERIVVVDANDRIVDANQTAREWAGHDPRGRSLAEVFPPCQLTDEKRSELELIHYTFKTRTAQRGRLFRSGPDGTRIMSVDTYLVAPAAEQPELVIAIAHDCTQHLEQEMHRRHQEKMAALGALAAGFAHDLGNPLASLSSELQLLRHETSLDRIRDSLLTLDTHVSRIARTMRDITDFSRRRHEQPSSVDVRQATNDALRMVKYEPRARGVAIRTDFSEGLPSARMKEDKLVLVLVNLVLNAFDAMSGNGVLTITGTPMESGGVRVLVKDTGAGMDEHVLANATAPLFTTKTSGTGLGLSMCKEIMLTTGGGLEISSERGKGTTVTLIFPPRICT